MQAEPERRHRLDSADSRRRERIQHSPNFRAGICQNPVPTTMMVPGKTAEVARDWLANGKLRVPPAPLPAVSLTGESFAAPAADDPRLVWFGHSTVLLEMEGQRLLFDPIWANRSSPAQWVGPARFQPPPLPLEQLPELTAVVISHDHYDHLDKDTIRNLAEMQPRVPFHLPLGVGAHLEKWGIDPERVRESDWWEETATADGALRLIAAPARHFSGRSLFDRNRTQWASWIVAGRSHRVYFGGDGGYHPGFADIGDRFGPFDLAMLEIGAHHPNWGQIHLGPEKALLAQRELRSRYLLPIHWGTFCLALHPWDEPITQLVAGARQNGGELLTPRLGQIIALNELPAFADWWTEVDGHGE
ncbi:MAG: hypothetical protein GX444_13755 [Myxococcales bacterium]|nr:hypothetical protein [Myxococcales bacterium]